MTTACSEALASRSGQSVQLRLSNNAGVAITADRVRLTMHRVGTIYPESGDPGPADHGAPCRSARRLGDERRTLAQDADAFRSASPGSMLWNETSVQTRVARDSCRRFVNRSDIASGSGGSVPIPTVNDPWRRRSDEMSSRRMTGRAIMLVAALAATLATSASVHAASLASTPGGLRYAAAAGEANAVRAWTDGRTLHLVDRGASTLNVVLPVACIAVPADLGVAVDCDARGDQVLRVDLGDGTDSLEAWELPRRVSLVVDAGSGDNLVEGGSGDDRIVGGVDRDTLYGGPGDDLVVGGDGNDYVRGHGGNDVIRGGEGLNFVIGDGGDDELHGGSSFEYFTAGAGNDVVYAGGGADDIGLGRGDDVAYGGADDDEIRGGPGADHLFGEGGDDLLRTRDGERDVANCGAGTADVARVDANELDEAKRSCETIRQADATTVDPADVDAITS